MVKKIGVHKLHEKANRNPQEVHKDDPPDRVKVLLMTKPHPDLTPSLLGKQLKVPEVADILQLSVRTVWGMIRAGELPYARYGRSVRVLGPDLAAFVERSVINRGDAA